jgi:hypothetical protein
VLASHHLRKFAPSVSLALALYCGAPPAVPAPGAVASSVSYSGDTTFQIGPVTLANDYDVQKLWDKLKARQQGVRMVI